MILFFSSLTSHFLAYLIPFPWYCVMGQTIICHHALCSMFYTRIIRSPRWGVLTTTLLIFRFEYST